MSITTDVLALTDRFADEWEADHDDIPYFVDNFPLENKPAATFARFIVDPNEVYHRAGGSDDPVMARTGRVIIQLCIPASQGTSQAWALADAARDIFHMWKTTDGYLRCSDTEITRREPLGTDPYFIVKLSTAYLSLRHG